jgi:hypothetical protein
LTRDYSPEQIDKLYSGVRANTDPETSTYWAGVCCGTLAIIQYLDQDIIPKEEFSFSEVRKALLTFFRQWNEVREVHIKQELETD